MTIHITPNDKGNPPGKLADAELHFDSDDLATQSTFVRLCAERLATGDATDHGLAARLREIADAMAAPRPLAGLKLIGFCVWERGIVCRTVTFPCRHYSVNGERRSFALLRPIVDLTAQDRIRDAILEAYAEYEEKAQTTA